MRKAVFWNYGQVWIRHDNNIRDCGICHSRTNWQVWSRFHGYKFVDVSGFWPEPAFLRDPAMSRQGNSTELVRLNE